MNVLFETSSGHPSLKEAPDSVYIIKLKERRHAVKSPAIAILAVAIVWAAVIFAVGSTLHDTPYLTSVLVYMGGGVAATLSIVGVSLRRLRTKSG
jgi:hypothetical protein